MNDIKSIIDIEAFALGLAGVATHSGAIIPIAAINYLVDKMPNAQIPGEYHIRSGLVKLLVAGVLGFH